MPIFIQVTKGHVEDKTTVYTNRPEQWFLHCALVEKEEYETALLNGSWMIGDNYLHVQRWVPNFVADDAQISALLLWIRFSVLPIECYIRRGLERVGNMIGKTLKMEETTPVASRDKFARVCIEVDLTKPLKEYAIWITTTGLFCMCYGYRLTIHFANDNRPSSTWAYLFVSS